MKQLRRIIFWCHLLTGVVVSLIVLLMSVTGVLLTYERQIVAWADRNACRMPAPPADAQRLSIETLLATVRAAQPGLSPATVTLYADPAAPAMFGLAGGRNLFVNPYTGEALGEGAISTRNFFRTMTNWHRWLGADGENRKTARAITGACNLGFLFIVISGLYLWWPRVLSRVQFKNILWFRRGLPGKARDFNWHNVIGFWSLVPLFIVVLSGVVISYPWASNLVYRVVGEAPPQPRSASGNAAAPRREGDRTAEAPLTDPDQAWARAAQQMPGWRSISLRLPAAGSTALTFTIDRGTGGQSHKRAQLTLNGSGEIVSREEFSGYSTGRKLRSFLRFAHTGEVGGLIGQTIAGLVSAGSVLLVWTGLALAWRRLTAWRARRARVPADAMA